MAARGPTLLFINALVLKLTDTAATTSFGVELHHCFACYAGHVEVVLPLLNWPGLELVKVCVVPSNLVMLMVNGSL